MSRLELLGYSHLGSSYRKYMPDLMIEKIVSGGQTGVDQAALRAAYELGITHGGWCPKGRTAENGKIPKHFQLVETHSEDVNVRTEMNVRDSNGTLILVTGEAIGGTKFTIEIAEKLKKPHLIFNLSKTQDHTPIVDWIKKNNIQVLNIAGPRESQAPGIQKYAYHFLKGMLANLTPKQDPTNSMKCKL